MNQILEHMSPKYLSTKMAIVATKGFQQWHSLLVFIEWLIVSF